MEKETELYLVNRIKDLETQLTFYKGFYDGTLEKGKPFKAEEVVCEYRGYNAEVLFTKAQAFDKLAELLGIEACHWVEQKRYELVLRKLGLKQAIDEETFEQLWGAINGN